MDANQIKAQYSGYAGWNDPAAIVADFKATGGQGKGGPSQPQQSSGNSNSVDYNEIYKQQQQQQQEAIKPVVQSLEAQKAPLQARYDALIQKLQGRETQETTAQQTALSQEYGKRGIPLSSGAFSQDLMGKTQQISQNYAGLQSEAVASEQADLANLATAISQAQASGNSAALQNALSIYQQNQSNKQAQDALALQNKMYQETTLPQSQASIANIQSEIANRGKSTGGGLGDLIALAERLNGNDGINTTNVSSPPQLSAPVGKLYEQPDGSVWKSNGASGWEQLS